MSTLEVASDDSRDTKDDETRDHALAAACTVHGREVTREIFDTLEERIVTHHASKKLEVSTLVARLAAASLTSQEAMALRIELAKRCAEAVGIASLAEYIGYISEAEYHGAHRRRLATLTVGDILAPAVKS